MSILTSFLEGIITFFHFHIFLIDNMGIISGPKAVNIVRPSNNNNNNKVKSNYSVKSAKVIHAAHEPTSAKPVLNIYNPKQQQQQPLIRESSTANQKKPVINLYNPTQLRRSFSTSVISPSRKKELQQQQQQTRSPQHQQTILSEEILRIHNGLKQSIPSREKVIVEKEEEEDLAHLSDSGSSDGGSSNSSSSSSRVMSDSEDEEEEEEEVVDDTLPEARINRKVSYSGN